MKYTKEFLEDIVVKSTCMWDVVAFAGVRKVEGNYTYISKLIRKNKIDTSHFIDQRMGGNRKERGLEEYLVKDKYLTLNGNSLKEKLYKANLKQKECEICGQGEIWRGNKISLIIDLLRICVRFNDTYSLLYLVKQNLYN
jgi:hypothetical protein